ncbi:right-handed parallel beta-helix repeat-containing protein, partial [Candidatus Pacearchaeota archaeon]|nr:right-handed parallel beta-helix repeat-containing protein [Candidatus Pacearchaeota archaeon]
RKGNTGYLYVDGILEASMTNNTLDSCDGNARTFIGARDIIAAPLYFNGSIDEVTIWNRALSEDEIKASYNAKTFSLFRNFTSLSEGRYDFRAFAIDSAGNYNQTETRTVTILDVTPPQLNFTNPTPPNGTNTPNSSVIINVSIIEQNLRNVIFNWNKTNYTIYNDSLVLMMNFDNRSSLGENDTFVRDLSRYGNNGTCIGANCPKWKSSGKYGGAFDFDGVNDYFFNGTNQTSLNLPGPLTISLWIKALQSSKQMHLIHSTGLYELIIMSNNEIRFSPDQAGTRYIASLPVNLADGRWHHILATFNGSSFSPITLDNAKIYLDGVSVGNSVAGTWLTSGAFLDLTIGQGHNANYFNGLIDEVRIWNRSLSAEEVREQYYSNLQKFNQSQWYLYVNQQNLVPGRYTYQGFASDRAGNSNSTEERTLFVNLSLSDCAVLDIPNAVYTLIKNVSSSGTCFTISANNVTLDCKGYEINYSTTTGSVGYGINVTNYNQATIKNCRIVEGTNLTNSKHAIYFSNSRNGTISNNTLFTFGDLSRGIQIESSSHSNNVIGNSFNTSASGITISASNLSNIENNSIKSYLRGYAVGIWLENAHHNNLLGNVINVSGDGLNDGILLSSTSANNFLSGNYININSPSGNGFDFSGDSNNNVTGNIIFKENIGGGAIILNSNSNGNRFLYNNISVGGPIGIGLLSSQNHKFIGNIIDVKSSGDSGINIGGSSKNNQFFNTTIVNSASSGEGILFSTSTNNSFFNTNITILNTPARAVLIFNDASNFSFVDGMFSLVSGADGFTIAAAATDGEWNFTNVTSNGNTLNVKWIAGAIGTLNVHWYVDAFANYSDGRNATNANIIANDRNNIQHFSAFTQGAEARMPRQRLLEYKQTNNSAGGTFTTYYSNYTIKGVSPEKVEEIFKTENLTTNKFLYYQFGVSGIDACGELNESKLYTLIKNVSSPITCFNITANNVALDCLGYEINYSYSGVLGYGVISNGYNFSNVKNCNIVEGSSVGNSKYGIYFNLLSNGMLSNNTIVTFGSLSHDIRLEQALFNRIQNNNLTTFGSGDGISLFLGSNYTIIENNTLSTYNSGEGIFHSFSSDSIINNNLISVSESSAIGISSVSGANLSIWNNQILINSDGGVGIGLLYSPYSILVNNSLIIFSQGGSAIGIDISQSNYLVIDNNIISTFDYDSDGIKINNGSMYILRGNIIITNETDSEGIIVFSNFNNALFFDSFINASLSTDLIFGVGSFGNVNFTNVTLTDKRAVFDSNSNVSLNVHWYLDVNVTNALGTPIENASVNISDIFSSLRANETLSTGFIPRQTLIEYSENRTAVKYFTNYTVNVSKEGYSSKSVSVNLTKSIQLNIILDKFPVITLIYPIGGEKVVTEGYAELNYSLLDIDNDLMEVWIYGSNDSSRLSDFLLYHKKGVGNGNFVYNWSGGIVDKNSDGLVALLHFDNLSELGENATFARDFSSYGNNASVQNGLWNETAKFAGGFEFNGILGNRNISVAHNNILNVKNFTISVWFVRRGDGTLGGFNGCFNDGVEPLTAKGGGGGDNTGIDSNWVFGINGTNLAGCLESPTGADFSTRGNTIIQNNIWYHATYVYNYTTLTLYLNGEVESSSVTNSAPANNNIRVGIGQLYEGASETIDSAFNGTIDEVAIWNRSLSADEIKELAKLTPSRYFWQVNASVSGISVSENAFFIMPDLPFTSKLVFNSTFGTNFTFEDLFCYAEAVDDPAPDEYLSINWSLYNGSSLFSSGITDLRTEFALDSKMIFFFHFNNDSAFGENSTHAYDHTGKVHNATAICGSGGNCPKVIDGFFGKGFNFSWISGGATNHHL